MDKRELNLEPWIQYYCSGNNVLVITSYYKNSLSHPRPRPHPHPHCEINDAAKILCSLTTIKM